MAVSCLDFAQGAGLTLSEAQAAFVRVAFDGETPGDTPTDRKLWGSWNFAPAAARKVVGAVCGRGSGKTLLGALRVVHLACVIDLSKLQKREVAVCPVVSTDKDTAQQVVRFALGICEALGIRVSHKEGGGNEGFSIVREGNRRVRVVAKSATVGGRNIRGRSMPCAVLDEAAFFRDSSHKVNDVDIYDALKPRIMTGGQIILLSSPWIEAGLLYELWRRNFSHPEDALVAHAPTGLMRTDDPSVLEEIELERSVDPEKCARERDAEFMTSNAAAFFDPRAVAQSIVEPGRLTPSSDPAYVGGDFAFRRNSSALAAIRALTESGRTVYELVGLKEMRPVGKPLAPTEVCEESAAFALSHGADSIIADGYSREAVAEQLYTRGVTHIISPAGATGKLDVYQTARNLFHEGQIRIPKALGGDEFLVDKLLRQLREIIGRPRPGGGLSIDSPTWRSGEHGDIADAFVLALWRAVQYGPKLHTAKDTVYMDELERETLEQLRAEEDRAKRIAHLTGESSLGLGGRRLKIDAVI